MQELRCFGAEHEKFDDVELIAVLRGGGLGDLLFAMPAIESLAAAYPSAEITLLGTSLHEALLANRPGPVDDVAVLPHIAGLNEPAGAASDHADAGEFVEQLRRRRFDLAVQVHGGGRNSNPFIRRLGARHTVGTTTPDAVPLERNLPYAYYQHEVLRALEVVGLAGAGPVTLEPRITPTQADRSEAAGLVMPGTRGLIALHTGATDPRRQWPPGHFAILAAKLAAEGFQVILVGTGEDRAVADSIVERALQILAPGSGPGGSGPGRSAPRDSAPGPESSRDQLISSAAGQLSLGGLTGLLSCSSAMAGNDSGPRHLAQAVGTPTVGIYWIGNAFNAGPLSRTLNRIQISWLTKCPVCGADVTQVGWTSARCEHNESIVAEIEPESVFADLLAVMATNPAAVATNQAGVATNQAGVATNPAVMATNPLPRGK
ncbi:glycosyltransferase family 9 protein [Saxibacter everestensis]|uniref:Glycosyltransferase family 9 protein n=1 Tax=Saxibacter everestensis TaxID=2909229 RepID=A0ABY8QTH2_9MICO|nr:glycosyltransferase family 9 protein [Brevibacteriaceae bacterium ZFBP1038]